MKAKSTNMRQKAAPISAKREEKAYVSNLVFEENFWAKHWKEVLLMTIPVVLLYMVSLNFEYVLDDQIVLTKNNYVNKGFGGIWDILSTETFMGYFGEQKNLVVGARYRPLSLVTFAIENQFVGQNSAVSHGLNILFYILSILLLYRILDLIFPKNDERPWYLQLSFLSSILFALHPIHSELVANVKGRDEIMVLLGVLGSMYATFRYVKNPSLMWQVLSFIFFFLGLLSKENALTFVAVIPLTLYFFTNARTNHYIGAAIPVISATVLYLIVRYQVIGYFLSSGVQDLTNVMNNPFLGMNVAQKYATIMYTLGKYLVLLVLPINLTHDYYPYHIPVMNWTKMGTILSFLAYAALLYIAYKGYKSKSIFSYCILFFVITLSIVSNLFFPIGTFMNERFIYISSIGYCIAWAYLFVEFLPQVLPMDKNTSRYLGLGFLILNLLGYSYKLYQRIPAWENPVTLNEAAIKVSYNSARSNNFTGTAYYNRYMAEKDSVKRLEWFNKAKPYIEKAVTIIPDYADGLQMKLGLATEEFKNGGSLDTCLQRVSEVVVQRPYIIYITQWLDYMDRIQPYGPYLIRFYIKCGTELIAKNDAPAAIKYLQRGQKLDPSNALILNLLNQAKGMPQITNRPYQIPEYMR
jgi:tetratricopeptide (TPR) repeat protein